MVMRDQRLGAFRGWREPQRHDEQIQCGVLGLEEDVGGETSEIQVRSVGQLIGLCQC